MLATDAETIRERRRMAPLLLLLACLSGERRAAEEEGEGEETAAMATTADERRATRGGDAPAALVVRLPFAGQAITGVRMATAEDIIGKRGEREQRSADTKGGEEGRSDFVRPKKKSDERKCSPLLQNFVRRNQSNPARHFHLAFDSSWSSQPENKMPGLTAEYHVPCGIRVRGSEKQRETREKKTKQNAIGSLSPRRRRNNEKLKNFFQKKPKTGPQPPPRTLAPLHRLAVSRCDR